MGKRAKLLLSAGALLLLAGVAQLVVSPAEAGPLAALSADPSEIVAFDDLQRAHFRALAVDRQEGAPSTRPLLVRLNYIGEAPDLARPTEWLRQHANVLLVQDPSGAPVVFLKADLATGRGNEALGATVPRGMAIETRDLRLFDCVFAHEILHFLGLRHADEADDLMHARCDSTKPYSTSISAAQRDQLQKLESIRAITLTGRDTWVERL